jgi:uncharacterized protein YjhX (UPF0386 family)
MYVRRTIHQLTVGAQVAHRKKASGFIAANQHMIRVRTAHFLAKTGDLLSRAHEGRALEVVDEASRAKFTVYFPSVDDESHGSTKVDSIIE